MAIYLAFQLNARPIIMTKIISKILALFGITWPKRKREPEASIRGDGGPGEETT